jgi:hypothetical protein
MFDGNIFAYFLGGLITNCLENFLFWNDVFGFCGLIINFEIVVISQFMWIMVSMGGYEYLKLNPKIIALFDICIYMDRD